MAAPKNLRTFPDFADGDVLIMSPTGAKWRLHHVVLQQSSPAFGNIFHFKTPYALTRKQVEEGKIIRWRLRMINYADDSPVKKIDPEGLRFKMFYPIGEKDKDIQFSNHNGLGAAAEFDGIYDNLFRCIYNLDPKFKAAKDKSIKAHRLVSDLTSLLKAAELVEALPAVRPRIESHLLRLNSILWGHIATSPEEWMVVACKLQSPPMLKEAMIHVCGQWHLRKGVKSKLQLAAILDEAGFGEEVFNLVVNKSMELHNLKLLVERRLLEYYPHRMHHAAIDGANPGQAIYSKDTWQWQALSIVRQFISTCFAMKQHHAAPDGGLSFYRTIAERSYINATTLSIYNAKFMMSDKGKSCLLQALEETKLEISQIVAPILRDHSEASRSLLPNQKWDRFTCIETNEEEMPWYDGDGVDVDMDDDSEEDVSIFGSGGLMFKSSPAIKTSPPASVKLSSVKPAIKKAAVKKSTPAKKSTPKKPAASKTHSSGKVRSARTSAIKDDDLDSLFNEKEETKMELD